MAGENDSVHSEIAFDPRNFVESQLVVAKRIEADAVHAVAEGLRDSDETRTAQRFEEVKQMVHSLTNAIDEKTISRDEFNTALAALIVDLETSAVFDDMTGLPARVVFERLAPKVLEKAIKANQHVVIFVADINCLKETNDDPIHGGHAKGDELIKLVAKALKHLRGESDILCRMAVGNQGGSDEFVWLATDTERKEAELIIAHIIRQVSDGIKELGLDALPYKPGVSIGIAEWRDGLTLKEILKQADVNMYDHKRQNKLGIRVSPEKNI